MTDYEKYAKDIESGKIISGNNIKMMVKRYRKFQNRDDMYFDADKVQHVIDFISNIRHYLGKYAGKPFILRPWQSFIIANIYGWIWKKNDLRVTRNFFCLVARKNGKSAFASALSLYNLIADGEMSPEVVFAANSREQSKIILDITTQFSKSLDPNGDILKIFRNEIKSNVNNGKAFIISADASKLDGKNISNFVLDEFHEAKNNKVLQVLQSSMGMRQQPLSMIISTAGFNLQSPCYELYKTAQDILGEVKNDDSFFSALFTLDEDDNWTLPENWKKSNPNLNITVTSDFIENEILKATNNPSDEVAVKTKTLNMWVSSSDVWISHEKIVKASKKLKIEDFAGETCYVGVDLASVNDLTAVSYMFIRDELYYFFTDYYLPQSALYEHKQKEYYKKQHYQKNLKITSGNSTDYEYIKEDILRIHNVSPVQSIFYDSWNSAQFAISMTEAYMNMIPYSQSVGNFNKPTKEFLRMMLKNKIVLDDNEITRFCFSNVVIFTDNHENQKPRKSNAGAKIDGVIAILQALGGYLDTERVEFFVSSF